MYRSCAFLELGIELLELDEVQYTYLQLEEKQIIDGSSQLQGPARTFRAAG